MLPIVESFGVRRLSRSPNPPPSARTRLIVSNSWRERASLSRGFDARAEACRRLAPQIVADVELPRERQVAAPFGAPRVCVDRSKAARRRSSHRARLVRWPDRGPANGTGGVSIRLLSQRPTIVCRAFALPRARQLAECARQRLRFLLITLYRAPAETPPRFGNRRRERKR